MLGVCGGSLRSTTYGDWKLDLSRLVLFQAGTQVPPAMMELGSNEHNSSQDQLYAGSCLAKRIDLAVGTSLRLFTAPNPNFPRLRLFCVEYLCAFFLVFVFVASRQGEPELEEAFIPLLAALEAGLAECNKANLEVKTRI